MRIPIICAVFAALFAFGIYMTGGTSDNASHADQSHSQAATANHDKATGEVKSGHAESAHGEQMDHARQMAHGMAAQHEMHDQAVQKEAAATGGHANQVHWGYKGLARLHSGERSHQNMDFVAVAGINLPLIWLASSRPI